MATRKRRLRLMLMVALLCAGCNWSVAHAAATHTITSARFGYSFSYPASWSAAPANAAYDALVHSPDGATTFAVQVSGGGLTATGARTVGLNLLHTLLGMQQSARLSPTVSTPAQPGGTAVQAEARATVSGQHRFAIARVVGYDGFSFYFYGVGPTPPTIPVDAPAIALHGILASVTLKTVRAQYTAPSVYFGLYHPLGWRRVSYPDLGKIVLNGPSGAVIFADYGRGASNAVDLRLLLLENASLMGKLALTGQNQASFSPTPVLVDGVPTQVVQVGITDKLGRKLTATIADASLNGYNYVFGGAAPAGSAAQKAIVDTITSATMSPPALPADTGSFINYANAAHHYRVQRPAAWIAGEKDPSYDASFTARDGDLSMVLLVRKGSVASVLTSLVHTYTQEGLTITKQTTTQVSLGTLPAQERLVQATVAPKLVEEIHLVAAASGNTVYILSWNFYVGVPDAAALQKLARRSQSSFSLTS